MGAGAQGIAWWECSSASWGVVAYVWQGYGVEVGFGLWLWTTG